MNIGVIKFSTQPYQEDTFILYGRQYGDRITIGVFPNDMDTHPEWNYSHEKVDYFGPSPSISIRLLGTRMVFNHDIIRWLEKNKFDVLLLMGYSSFTNIYALFYARHFDIPVIMFADTIESGRLPTIKKYIYNMCASFWVPGSRAEKYLYESGISKNKIYRGMYTYDYKKEKRIIDSYDVIQERERLGIDANSQVFLFVGKLIPTRRVGLLLESFSRLHSENVRLIIIGDGPEEHLVQECDDNRLVHIPRVPLADLYKYYAIADVYVHPGGEPFSLALVQAVAADLVVVTSDLVGASDDVVDHCGNGFIFTSSNPWELSEYMEMAIEYYDVMSIAAEEKGAWLRKNRSIEFAASELHKAIGKAANDE